MELTQGLCEHYFRKICSKDTERTSIEIFLEKNRNYEHIKNYSILKKSYRELRKENDHINYKLLRATVSQSAWRYRYKMLKHAHDLSHDVEKRLDQIECQTNKHIYYKAGIAKPYSRTNLIYPFFMNTSLELSSYIKFNTDEYVKVDTGDISFKTDHTNFCQAKRYQIDRKSKQNFLLSIYETALELEKSISNECTMSSEEQFWASELSSKLQNLSKKFHEIYDANKLKNAKGDISADRRFSTRALPKALINPGHNQTELQMHQKESMGSQEKESGEQVRASQVETKEFIGLSSSKQVGSKGNLKNNEGITIIKSESENYIPDRVLSNSTNPKSLEVLNKKNLSKPTPAKLGVITSMKNYITGKDNKLLRNKDDIGNSQTQEITENSKSIAETEDDPNLLKTNDLIQSNPKAKGGDMPKPKIEAKSKFAGKSLPKQIQAKRKAGSNEETEPIILSPREQENSKILNKDEKLEKTKPNDLPSSSQAEIQNNEDENDSISNNSITLELKTQKQPSPKIPALKKSPPKRVSISEESQKPTGDKENKTEQTLITQKSSNEVLTNLLEINNSPSFAKPAPELPPKLQLSSSSPKSKPKFPGPSIKAKQI